MLQNILLGSSKKTGLPGSTKFCMYHSRIREYRPSEEDAEQLASLIDFFIPFPMKI